MEAPKNITLCADGKYRWTYEFSMLKNPMILLTVFKIFFWIAVGLFVFLNLLDLFNGHFSTENLPEIGKTALIMLGVFFGLSLLSYFILACIYGWKYCVCFEMDDKGIRHIQLPKQFKKAQAIAWVTTMAGFAGGSPGTAGAGLLAGARSELSTEFCKVKKIRVKRRFNTIKLDSPLNHNQIYADPEDIDFVIDYIRSRTDRNDGI